MTPARPQPPERPATVPWRAWRSPLEHGGWGFLVEPLVLGLVLAPSAAGACLALAAAAGFLARHPLRLWLLDSRKHVRYPRTALAERVFAGYALVALLLLAADLALAPAPFWPPLVVAAPIGLVALGFDAAAKPPGPAGSRGGSRPRRLRDGDRARRRRSRRSRVGRLGPPGPRAVTSVLYVRARIADRGLPTGPRAVHAGHAVALAAAVFLARRLGAVAGRGSLLRPARAIRLGFSSWRRPIRPQALGFQELGYGMLTLALLAFGYRLDL